MELSLFTKDVSDMTLFPDKFFYTFHRMSLKLGGQLDYEEVREYFFKVTVHQILIESLLFKDCSDTTSFPMYSSFTFHWIGLKLGGQLDHAVI